MRSTIHESVLLSTSCYFCGVPFAFPTLEERRRDGKEFYCPNGHGQIFGDPLHKQLARQLDEERTRRRDAEELAVRVQSKYDRIKRRIHRGVCPHCNRTFENIARHMKSKHGKCLSAS